VSTRPVLTNNSTTGAGSGTGVSAILSPEVVPKENVTEVTGVELVIPDPLIVKVADRLRNGL
jgi:hypothetical protein